MTPYDHSHPQYNTAVYPEVGMSPWMSKHGATPDTSNAALDPKGKQVV